MASKEKPAKLFEIGCAVGNTIFPLFELYAPFLKLYGVDISPRAIEMIKKAEKFDENFMNVAVCDIVKD